MNFATIYCVDDNDSHDDNDIYTTNLNDARFFATLKYENNDYFRYVRGHYVSKNDYEFNPDDFIYPLTLHLGDAEPSEPLSLTNFSEGGEEG